MSLQSVWQKHKYINRKFKNAEKNYSQIPKLKTQKLKFEIHKYKSKKLQIQQIDVPSWDAECWAQAFASFHFFHTSAKTSISTNTEKNTKVINIDMFFEESCVFINSCHVIIQHKIPKHLYDIHYIHTSLYSIVQVWMPFATCHIARGPTDPWCWVCNLSNLSAFRKVQLISVQKIFKV